MNPTSKAPGTKRLILKYDEQLSILLKFCFQFKLRRYIGARSCPPIRTYTAEGLESQLAAAAEAFCGPGGVGRCRLTLSNPC